MHIKDTDSITPEGYLSVAEYAAKHKISQSLVYYYIHTDKFEKVVHSGRKYFIKKNSKKSNKSKKKTTTQRSQSLS